jgi:hypothetical protein
VLSDLIGVKLDINNRKLEGEKYLHIKKFLNNTWFKNSQEKFKKNVSRRESTTYPDWWAIAKRKFIILKEYIKKKKNFKSTIYLRGKNKLNTR